jgi:UDP-GlcNAc:undecaprenyl-phosphate GlcNAc-1-phosphate transferase
MHSGLFYIFLATVVAALCVVATRRWHARWTGDFEDSGVQKHHKGSPPRVGALPLLAGLAVAFFTLSQAPLAEMRAAGSFLQTVLWCAVPVLALGLADDLTKRVPPRARMLGAAMSAGLAVWLLDAVILRSGIPVVDSLLSAAFPLALALTVLLVAGLTNAMNIVDGLNGLAGGLGVFMLLATAVLAHSVGDVMLMQVCLAVAAAVLGFLVINFPRGLMFLGDGGAYLIGFLLVQIWIALVTRHPELTPWAVVAIAIHPTMETIFSIYRRRLHRGRAGIATLADRLHLHSLIYRRRTLPWAKASGWAQPWVANAAGSLSILAFAALPMVLVVWGKGSGWASAAAIALGVGGYLYWYRGLVMAGRASRAPVPTASSVPASDPSA